MNEKPDIDTCNETVKRALDKQRRLGLASSSGQWGGARDRLLRLAKRLIEGVDFRDANQVRRHLSGNEHFALVELSSCRRERSSARHFDNVDGWVVRGVGCGRGS